MSASASLSVDRGFSIRATAKIQAVDSELMRDLSYAKATFRKDRRLNIRLSSKDLDAIQTRALAEGLAYQTLISSLLHEYAAGRLDNAGGAQTCAQSCSS